MASSAEDRVARASAAAASSADDRVARASAAAARETRALDALFAASAAQPPLCAALLRAWYAIACFDAVMRGAEAPISADFVGAVERGEPSAGPASIHVLPGGDRRALVATAVLPAPPPAEWARLRALLEQRSALTAWLDDLSAQARAGAPRRPPPRTLFAGALAVVLAGALLVALRRPPVWRVVYFSTTELADPIASDLTADLGGNWGEASPHRGVPADGFSDRWETCLILDRPHDVSWALGSDDGARLRIDDAVVIDRWRRQSYAESTATVRLDAGAHVLRVEHFDSGLNAELSLRMKLDGDKDMGPIPRSRLRRPGTGPQPCAR